MDTLVQVSSNSMTNFQFNPHAVTIYQEQILGNGHKQRYGSPSPSDEFSSGGDSFEEPDNSDAIFKYISQMLMEEEDLEHRPCMLHDCSALQAAEKSFYDLIGEKYPPSDQHDSDNITESNFTRASSSLSSSGSSIDIYNSHETNWIGTTNPFDSIHQPNLLPFNPSNNSSDAVGGIYDSFATTFQILDLSGENQLDLRSKTDIGAVNHFLPADKYPSFNLESRENTSEIVLELQRTGKDPSLKSSGMKKNHFREDSDYAEDGRNNKHLASCDEESEQTEIYDKVLLCPGLNPHLLDKSNLSSRDESSESEARNRLQLNEQSKGGSNRGKRRGGKKRGIKKEVVDLRGLLTQCAQAVASYDSRTANELLRRIRQHSSPFGDGTERLAYYFADALEARLAGTGTILYTAFKARRITAADILKAYQRFMTACPFKKLSNIFANKSIRRVSSNAKRLHIIDFGILYGFQWPCLIQGLSMRPGGPPKLRITGIELPQPGGRPAERVEATGVRLANYCKRFNVPFKYNAIAKKWDTIRLEDLKIDRDEMIVVNCLYRLGSVPDETVVASSPRDAVLNLIKSINPNLFIHGIVNGTFNAPFFVTRFREALFHFSAMFDMFEATVSSEDQERLLYEREILGRDAMNVIACEGTERVERPETYKQWQVRNMRARFRQLPLDQEIVKFVRGKVKAEYHRDFSVDEDSNWMLQGWKGRVLYSLSCWKASHDS